MENIKLKPCRVCGERQMKIQIGNCNSIFDKTTYIICGKCGAYWTAQSVAKAEEEWKNNE